MAESIDFWKKYWFPHLLEIAICTDSSCTPTVYFTWLQQPFLLNFMFKSYPLISFILIKYTFKMYIFLCSFTRQNPSASTRPNTALSSSLLSGHLMSSTPQRSSLDSSLSWGGQLFLNSTLNMDTPPSLVCWAFSGDCGVEPYCPSQNSR